MTTNIVINGQPVNVAAISGDVKQSMSQGFTGHGWFTPQAVLAMIDMIEVAPVLEKGVPRDYEAPNWLGKNRVYEWKNYISAEIQALWNTLTQVQKVELSKEANYKALSESWEY